MIKEIFELLKSGFQKLRRNPQLWYTILVALLIVVAFVFVADRFVTIAQDAQNRLVNQRLGSLQDSFVRFAPDYLNTEIGVGEIEDIITKIFIEDSTLTRFHVVEFNEKNEPIIIASANKDDVGKKDEENSFFYNLATGRPTESFTIPKQNSNGRSYTTIKAITDKYGEIVGAVLTEQSMSEADQKVSESINNSVVIFVIIVILIMFLFFRHARIIDYVSLYKRLQEVDQLKDDFISMASHELRTPLTVIRGYAENLREAKEMNEEAKMSAERIDIAAKQLDDLVADMLDVSRIEQGRMRVDMANISPVALLNEIATNYVGVARDKGLKLTLKNELSASEVIFADLGRLKQVLVNLVGNSIKYTLQGEVTMSAKREGQKIIITVSDTGLGISAEEQKHLFEKFYRIQNKDTQNIRGTGLGLWITKQIVELMQGKIFVESIKGVGTHFIVEFPVVG